MIRRGDKVTFKPEWRDAGDGVESHIALEDEDGGRVAVEARNTGLPLPPISVVWIDMIESVTQKSGA